MKRNYGEPGGAALFKALVDSKGIAALAEVVERRLDERAGPWALTQPEREIRRLCRQRFGCYQPDELNQVAFIRQTRADQLRVAA